MKEAHQFAGLFSLQMKQKYFPYYFSVVNTQFFFLSPSYIFMFPISELMYSNWKHKLSRCKNTFFLRFHKIIIIVFSCAIRHGIVQIISEIRLSSQLFVISQRQTNIIRYENKRFYKLKLHLVVYTLLSVLISFEIGKLQTLFLFTYPNFLC